MNHDGGRTSPVMFYIILALLFALMVMVLPPII